MVRLCFVLAAHMNVHRFFLYRINIFLIQSILVAIVFFHFFKKWSATLYAYENIIQTDVRARGVNTC